VSFEVKTIEVRGNQIEVDLILYSCETTPYEMTFDRSRIESLGIDWRQFVKSVHEVVAEMRVKAEARDLASG